MTTRSSIPVEADVIGCCSPLGNSVLSERESDETARMFGALSNPTRRRMLSLIASEDEVCGCALEGPLEKSQPTISHHTRVFAEAGLIEGEKRGRWIRGHVVPERLKDVARILSA